MMSPEAKKQHERYLAAAHAMQSAIAFTMQLDAKETDPKYLRVGVNAAMVEHAALVGLLVEKSLFTWEEYFTVLADKMEAEVKSYDSSYL